MTLKFESPNSTPETKKSKAYFQSLTAMKGSSGLPVSRYGMPFFSAASAAGLPTDGVTGPMMATAPSLLMSVSTLLDATLASLLSSSRTILMVAFSPSTVTPPLAFWSAAAASTAHFSNAPKPASGPLIEASTPIDDGLAAARSLPLLDELLPHPAASAAVANRSRRRQGPPIVPSDCPSASYVSPWVAAGACESPDSLRAI